MPRSMLKIASLMMLVGLGESASAADGYFLTGEQKSELIMRGQMHDDQQRLYDIWIVPGYVMPAEHARKGWRKAGDALDEYGKPSFYREIHRFSDATWRYGTQEVLRDFALKGTRKAWLKDMEVAAGRTRKRVFGWWLAYPWGIFEATTESVIRVVGGIPTGVAVAVSAYTVVPVVYGAVPVTLSAGHALGEGTGFPLAAAGWNTVIAPPLALLGQRPAPERADGFWMKQIDDPRLKDLIAELTGWRDGLVKAQPTTDRDAAVQRLQAERENQTREWYARIRAIEKVSDEQIAGVRSTWMNGVLQRAGSERGGVWERLKDKDIPPSLLAGQRESVIAALTGNGWSQGEVEQLVRILLGEGPVTAPQRQADDKTDPLKRAVEILGDPDRR